EWRRRHGELPQVQARAPAAVARTDTAISAGPVRRASRADAGPPHLDEGVSRRRDDAYDHPGAIPRDPTGAAPRKPPRRVGEDDDDRAPRSASGRGLLREAGPASPLRVEPRA